MVAQRRFGPLIALMVVGLFVLCARLFDVQILEHEIWAREATSLLRSSKVVPYHRGTITDRHGTVFVRDQDVYQVDFCYRDFRRGHPIAQLAHARSALELRAVPLTESLAHLDEWARELVLLTPAALDRFARGGALEPGDNPAEDDAEAKLLAEREHRARRASDLRYYVGELLDVTPKEWRNLRGVLADARGEQSYLELVAAERKQAPQALLGWMEAELAQSRGHLGVLAELLRAADALTNAAAAPDALAALVGDLEAYRRQVEDAVADSLFAAAAGFAPGRISSASLQAVVDTSWIARLMRWDDERLHEWAGTRRAMYLRELEHHVLPRILAHVEVLEEAKARPARLLSEIAALYVPDARDRRKPGEPPLAWSELDELCVLDELDSLFVDAHWPADFEPARAPLPLMDEELRALEGTLENKWLLVGMVGELCDVRARAPEAPRNSAEAAARWAELDDSTLGMESPRALEELAWLVLALEGRFETECDRALRVLLASHADADLVPAPLELARERRDRAVEQEKFLLKDKSNRSVLLCPDPQDSLVHLLARFPERYRGFEVRETTRREAVAHDAQGTPVARQLIGAVRKPSLSELFAQQRDAQRLSSLLYKVIRTAADATEIGALSARLYRSDEFTGGFGIEDYFDQELRGKYGYRETQGLAQREGGAPTLSQPPVDGRDVELTLDIALQLAAQETLAHPKLPGDPQADRLWFENPIGAIVLITPQGEILAAASEPSQSGHAPTRGRNAERTRVRERTLQRPTFNPPGSVFKPFVAAYALERMNLDPRREFVCAPLPDGGSGYKQMHCHGVHGACDLRRALVVSCNAYFAQLGETFAPEGLLDMAGMFGFGQPTGVRHLGIYPQRSGLLEHWKLRNAEGLAKSLEEGPAAMRFANGLSLIEATPMQVARATAGVLTGRLPQLRIERAIGGVPTELVDRDVEVSPEHLELVRRALADVVREPGGTAADKGLDQATLGFGFACKTGSADTEPFKDTPELSAADRHCMEAGKVRKHTWVAGWFPLDDPKAVVVVYLHDVSETASHTSVYVAAQLLRHPAVKAFALGADHTVPAADASAPEEAR